MGIIAETKLVMMITTILLMANENAHVIIRSFKVPVLHACYYFLQQSKSKAIVIQYGGKLRIRKTL